GSVLSVTSFGNAIPAPGAWVLFILMLVGLGFFATVSLAPGDLWLEVQRLLNFARCAAAVTPTRQPTTPPLREWRRISSEIHKRLRPVGDRGRGPSSTIMPVGTGHPSESIVVIPRQVHDDDSLMQLLRLSLSAQYDLQRRL